MLQLKLQNELDALKEKFAEAAPEAAAAFEKMIQKLREKGTGKGLAVGAKVPDFTLGDTKGQGITLYEELQRGPVILVFYRGAWCPFCNLELKAYQRIMDDIKAAGTQLIAISPQTPDNSLSLKEKHELTFHVLSDPSNHVAEAFNLKFKIPEYLIELHRSLNMPIDQFNGDNSWEIPVPATYVIDRDGIICAAVTDPDFRTRMEPNEVLNLVRTL